MQVPLRSPRSRADHATTRSGSCRAGRSAYVPAPLVSPSGGIGRRSGFKIRRPLKACGFKSHLGHHGLDGVDGTSATLGLDLAGFVWPVDAGGLGGWWIAVDDGTFAPGFLSWEPNGMGIDADAGLGVHGHLCHDDGIDPAVPQDPVGLVVQRDPGADLATIAGGLVDLWTLKRSQGCNSRHSNRLQVSAQR